MRNKFSAHLLWLALLLTTVVFAKSVEYRIFTNNDGKTIVARVIEYDAEASKVRLELKNRKKAWLSLADLSEEDQEYITQWSRPPSEPDTSQQEKPSNKKDKGKELSRSELRDIGKKYLECLENKDYELWLSLLCEKPEGVDIPSREQFEYFVTRITGRNRNNVSIQDIKQYYIEVSVEYDDNREGYLGGLLFDSANGKIKYDMLYFKHPFREACRLVGTMKSFCTEPTYLGSAEQRAKAKESAYSGDYTGEEWSEHGEDFFLARLEPLGVPTYGYNEADSDREKRKCVKQMVEWILDQDEDWDIGEPKLSYPRHLRSPLIDMLRRMKVEL